MLEREVFLKNDRGAAMQPNVLVRSDDGGFVVAGSITATKQGWATKVAANGKVLWNYYRDLQQEDQAAFAGHFVRPEYHGAVPMPDGSVYLCGDLPHPIGTSPLLTHLDAQGKLIAEQLVNPKNLTTQSRVHIHHFDSCLRWGNDFVIVGNELYIDGAEEKSTFYHLDLSYWILLLDASGNVKWEQKIPSKIKHYSFISEGVNVVQTGANLIISATDNTVTELISINSQGELQAQKKLDGYFQLVRPTSPDGLLQVYGSFVSNTKAPRVKLSLTEKLDEIERVQGDRPTDFATRRAYRMPDQSLVFFGSSIHSFGAQLRSGMVYADRLLQEDRLMAFDKAGFQDGGTIDAAAPGNQPGEFVTARWVFTLDPGSNNPEDGASRFRRGAVLNFVQLKK